MFRGRKRKAGVRPMNRIAAVAVASVSAFALGCRTPLGKAAVRGDTAEIRALLDAGADINQKDSDLKFTPLEYAISRQQHAAARLLIERGASLTAGHQGPILVFALQRDADRDTVKLLIDKGADVNQSDRYRLNPLIIAASEGRMDLVRILVARGADVEHATAMCEKNPRDVLGGRFISNAAVCLRTLSALSAPVADSAKPARPAFDRPIRPPAAEPPATEFEAEPAPARLRPSERAFGEDDLAVVIGIERYQSVPKSEFSSRDADLLRRHLAALGFSPRNVEVIADEKATFTAIKKAVETWLPNRAKPASRVVFYYSGHGAPDPATGEAFLLPHDGDPNYLEDTGYPLKRLYQRLGQLKAAEAIVLLDSCFSGTGGRSVIARGARPLVLVASAPSLPPNLAVLSAARGSQISGSLPEKGHGIFTFHLAGALAAGARDLADVYERVRTKVEDDAKARNVEQAPDLRPGPAILEGRFAFRR